MLVRALPCRPVYRRLRRFVSNPYGRSGAEMFGLSSRWLRPPAGSFGPWCPISTLPWPGWRGSCGTRPAMPILCQEYEYARFDIAVLVGARLGLPVFASSRAATGRSAAWSGFFAAGPYAARAGSLSAPAAKPTGSRPGTACRATRSRSFPTGWMVDFWHAEDRAAARAALGLPADDRIAIWHGRVDIHQKGLDLLLAAWKALRSADGGGSATLLLVGTGRDAASLGKHLADLGDERIIWVDRYLNDRPLIRRYLSAADLYVLPSRHEASRWRRWRPWPAAFRSSPPTCRESSTSCRTARVRAGLVVPQEDAPALAAALERLLESPDERSELGARARSEAERNFSLGTLGMKLRSFMFEPGQDPGQLQQNA